jgi:hypothetical protein
MILGLLTRQLKRKLLLEAVMLGVGAYKAIRDPEGTGSPTRQRAATKRRKTSARRAVKGKRRYS